MAKRSTRHFMSDLGWAVLPFVCLIAFWIALRATGLINPTLLPPPETVLQLFWSGLTTGDLLKNVGMSVQRVVFGLLLGMLVAVPVGFLIGWYKPVRRFV